MFQFFKKNNKQNGFTLVETLIALFIFSLSVIVVMAVLSTGISSTIYARDKTTATYLAEEGIEYFRNMRDTKMLYSADKQVGWADFVYKLDAAGCDDAAGCYFLNGGGTTNLTVTPCSGACPNLWYYYGTYDYNNSGVKTVFIRKMTYEPLWDNQVLGDEIKITSEVLWKQQGKTNSMKFSENISDWIE
jgi:prepilin-type N-terminal cleavage/methylation domain-containing protein